MKNPNILLIFKTLIIVIAATILTSGCKKEKQPSAARLHPEFLSYFSFPVGSKWNYKEINSNKTDINYITKSDTATGDGQRITITYESLTHTFSGYATATECNGALLNTFKLYTGSAYDPYDSEEGLFYPGKAGESEPCTKGQLSIIEFYDSLTIQGNTYKSVFKTSYNSNMGEVAVDNNTLAVYYCKNVGVIKRETVHSGTWELTSYHIEK